MTLCTCGVFSTVRKSASVPMSMPSSASAARVSFSRRFLKAGSTQARATTLAPSAGERLSIRSMAAVISCAVITPFSISSERTASSSTS
jgi:hypothetical protein